MNTTGSNGIRAALFVRESVAANIPGQSNDTQLERLYAHCDEVGLEVVRTYREVGDESTYDRPVFNQMVADLASGAFDNLVCVSFDRLSRSATGLLRVIEASETGRASLVSLAAPGCDPREVLICISIWEESKNVMGQQAQLGRIAVAERGRIPGGRPPYGYMTESDGRIKIDECAATVVRNVFHLYVNRRLSTNRIAALLNERGIASPGNAQSGWTRSSVLRLISNRACTGRVKYCSNRGGIVEGRDRPRSISIDVPMIVDQHLWDRAAELRARRSKGQRSD